jgi:tetratricopeptide (TPR) repeat protein
MAEQAQAISKMALKRLPKEEDPFKNRPARREETPAATRPGESVPELERPLPPRAAEPGLPPEAAAVLAKANRLVAQTSQAYRTGDIKEAAKLAGEALAADPDDVRALQVRAAANAKAGNWEDARKDADRGLDLAPGYVPLLLLRAAASAHAKDWKGVTEDAGAVLAKEGANPTAWRFQGLAQAALGDRAAATASLSRAAQHGDPEAPRLLAAARSLPPGADVVDLVELLAGSAAEREASGAARAAPPAAPPSRGGRLGLVVGAAVLAGVVAGGLILLLGRRDTESA